jgi:hypothetical protein
MGCRKRFAICTWGALPNEGEVWKEAVLSEILQHFLSN